MFMADWFQKTVQNIGPIARYNEKEEQRRIEENKSTLDKVLDTAGDIAGGISNNYNWAKNTLSEYVPESIQKTIAPFGDMSPIGLLFSGLTGANEVEHAMQQTYAPTAAEYNYNAGKGAISGASGVVGGIADIFGAEGTGNELNAITKLNQRDKEYSGTDNILSLDYLTNPSGFIYDLGNMGGSMAALYPSSLLAAPARVTSAAQAISRLPFLRGLSQGAYETMLRGSLTSIPEGLSEGGNVVRQAKEEGLDNPFLRGWTTAALNIPMLAVSNAAEYGLLGGKLFRPGAGVNEGIPERMVRGLYRAVPATAATSFQQGAEEYVQQGISNAQTDKDWGLLPWNASQDQIDALLVGAMTGAPMSGAASYGRSLTTREEERGVPKGVENPQAWKAAEIAANDVGRPDLAKSIYSQWALESGRFKETSGENNYGGLKDTNGNYRDYDSIEEFAHSYANDFLRHYDLSGVETPRDFVHVLKQNGYMEADENQYADNVESIASEIQGNGTASLHTYNLAVQPGIENQLDGLTPSFRNALPYIGGILDEMGMADGSAISSAYRTPEHNREVGGVEGSYHTKGDAVDIVLPDGITDEQAQAVKKRFEDTGAFEDVLFHDAGSGYHLHLEGYKGGLGRAGKTDTATSNVNYDNALMDFADDMINNSDGETSNFFDDKTMTDANGNKTFRATPNNIRALEQRYPEAVRKIRDYVQNGTNNQTALINNNTTRTGASGSTDNTNTINIETPSLDRLREFARRKVKTSRNPEEINNLQALFKNRNEDSGEFSNNQRAQEYLMKNYVNELQRNGTTAQGSNAQQNAPKPTNNTVNPQNNNNQSQQTSPIAQIAEQARQQERQSNELLTRINNNVNQPAYGVINGQQPSQDNFAQDIFANLIRQQQQADEQARRQAEIERQYNQINSGLTTTEIPATSGTQYEQDNLAQDIFTNTVRQQQQADEQARRQADVEKQYSQIKGGLNATENPATTGTQATAPINQQRLQEVSNDVKRYVKARDEFSRQENINKLARNINSLFNGDYTMPNDGADESRYSLRKLSEAINKEKRRNEIYNSLTPEEQEFMNWLDVVYDNTGKLFKDIYKNVLDERTQKINDYKEILRSQMKQGVTPRSVAYNRDTGEYTNLPGFSNNYQWYRDMTANGTRRISKKELEENLEYIAIDHLSNGYVDPQYGVHVPPEAVEDFKQTEDAINGLQEIAGKAQRYEEGRSLSRISETGRTESQRNIQQTQTETTAAIRRDAIHYGKKLHDRLRQAKERGEIQNPTSVNLERLEKDINSDSPVKQKKAIEFMENKLDKELPTKEKIAFREEVINELAPKREKGTTPNTEALQDETSTEKEMTEQKPKTKYKLAEGYKTESGNSLAEADENEYVIKPDGSMDFGKITEEISQETNGELQPGKIRLRVGNEKQGLIHAKKHEKQAQHIGYKSVEDMISDVAQNFDVIYKKDNGKGKRATYSLVKLNNNNTKAKQNVVPTYFELQNDGSNYYIVITAIPKNVGSFRNQIKKETLIYSKQGQDIAAISSDSAVRLSQSNNNAGVTEERLPVSVKSNVSSTNSISENEIANNQQSVFGSVEDAEENLLKVFGLKRANITEEKPKETKPVKKRVKIVDDSNEALEAEWDKLNKALDNLSANPLFNPDIVVPLFKIGMIYAQRGINNFADFSERMVKKGGDRIKPWTKPAWNMTASYEGNDLDEKKLAAAFQYVGSKWENGETALGKIKHDFQQLVGKEAAEPYMQYIDTAYKGAQAYFNPDTPVIQLKENTSNEVNENVNGTASSNTQRNSERNNQNAVGNTDEGEVAAGRSGNEDNGQTSQNTARRSSVRVQSSSSDTGGKAGNSAVRNDKSANTNGSTRDTDLPRSIRDSYEGSTVSDEGRTETVDRVVEERPVNEINSLKQDKAIPKERASRLESIKHDLPKLFPEQQNDVLFAETRLLENNKPGVLFTNGTGTGKTYTGLGVLKRFVNDGKKNILIVTPKNDINKAWIDAAKKDFDLNITPLKDKQDKGNGIVITTYANFGDNDALVNRDWDLILCDESHYLMANAGAANTNSLRNLRALTYHQLGLNERVDRIYSKEKEELRSLVNKRRQEGDLSEAEENRISELFKFFDKKRNELVPKWSGIPEYAKPKVVFLSASPFPHTFNIDYTEGYLFDFGQNSNKTYDEARSDFYIKHFGYRIRYSKLTRPDADVDTSLMEIQFNQWLKETGAASGRVLVSDKDYDRGFIRIGSGVGAKIDEGLEYIRAHSDEYSSLEPLILGRLKGNGTKYILEAVKAQNSIPLIKQYLKSGKKIVMFHDFRKSTAKNPFAFTDEDFRTVNDEGDVVVSKEARLQYEKLKKARPDLVNLNLNNLKSPINTLKEAFGDNIGIYNGEIAQKERTRLIKEFNDDNSKLNIILIQRKAGKEGISLHDKTGKHQRVMMDLGLPTTPTDTIQCEGRIYRVGVKSDAILRYLNTGTTVEKYAFATTIASRASTAENLAMGNQARRLKEAYIEAFLESDEGDVWRKYLPGSKTEGTGGKENDRRNDMSISGFDKAKTFYYAQQKKNARTRAQEGLDYFATPEPLGYKMVEWADIKSGESVLEPSAGHGAIARFFPNDTKNTAIEPSRELASTVRMNMLGSNNRIIEDRFENLSLNNKYDTIVMNPPFGTASKTAMEHLAKAFKHLRNGGRVVALVPAGSSMQKRLDKWLYGEPDAKEKATREGEKKAVLMKKIELPSVTFERAGTKVVTDIYIIDKYDDEDVRMEAAGQSRMTTSLRDVDNIKDFFDRIENLSVPERISVNDKTERTVSTNTDNTINTVSNGNVNNSSSDNSLDGRLIVASVPRVETQEVQETATQESSQPDNVPEGFAVDDYVHTKNNTTLKRATMTQSFDKDEYKQIKALAQQSNGYYSRYAKGFLFDNEDDRNNFLNAVKGSIKREPTVISRTYVPVKNLAAIPEERRKIIEAYANNPGIAVFEDADVGGYGVLATRKTDHSFFMGDHLTENEYALYKAVKDGLVDESTLLENKDSDKFIKIADSRDNAQYSLEDDMRKKLKNYTDLRETAVMLEDNELTDREKEISEIGKRLGTPVMWFKAAPGFRGWHSDGITYLNKNANWSHPKVFWHEVFHWIRNNNPKLFADMVNYIQTRAPFTGKQLDDYAATIHNGQNMTDAELVEEMMADNMVYVTRRVKFLRDLGKINHSLVKRFVYAIHDLMNRFIDFLNNPRAGLTNKQKKLMVTAFTNTAMSIKDQKGNNIFKKGSDGEIVIDDNRDLYSMSKEEEDMLKEIYGEDLSDLFNDDDDYSARFSADNDKSIDSGTGTFKGAFRNIKQRFTRRKNDKRIKVYNKSARDTKIDKLGNIGGFEAILASPSRLAEKYPAFKPVLTYAENAMRRLLKNRNYYNKKLNEAYDYLEDKEKDLQELNDLMFKGDAVSTEYGKGIEDFEERAKAIVEETGVKEGTAKAYIAIRKLLDECYNIVNRARTQVQIKSETISKSQLEGLKQNKFVTILNEVQSETKEDDVLVTYEIRPSRIKKDIVTKQQLEELRKNEAIQIMEEREGVREKDGSEYVYGNDYSTPKGEKINLENNKLYTVKYREAIPKVNKLEGYIPHFFHDFFVVVQNEDGTTTTVDSGHNVKEAYQKAEQYLKDNKDAKLIIRPKRFDFQEVGIDEEYYAEMVGDGAYQKINERIADEFDMTIDEAKKLLDNKNKKMPKPKRSSRHRFWGNIQHRTGAKGYESQDLDWVLRHYFNSACRYEALETEFKPKAIGYFERIYGRFDTDNKKLSGTARYIKDYINDVNGNPSAMEVAISTWLNNRRLFRYMFTSRYGERAALSVAAGITNKMSIAKLGVWNVSSALLNLTQLLNTTALLTRKNPVKAAWEIARACKDVAALTEKQSIRRVENLKPDERKALEDSGVFDELGLDSGAGYSKISFGKWANRSMVLFKAAERLARYATVLAAYRMGRNELNKNHDEAVEYAREINRKANFDYGVNDAPNLFRRGSILSQILFQFYKYPIKQFELMREFMPFNGKKDTTWQQKATFWGGWIFFAGAFGLPAEDLLWATIDLISENVFGIKSKQAVRQFLLEASKDASLPERVAIRTLMYGGLSNFGIDISTRVGMADVIPGLGEDYNKDANPLIKAAEQFGGVTGGTIAQFYNSATKGDNMGMLRAISPGAYNIYTAAIGESTDGRGRITTKYDDALSRIIRGMGFKSTTEAVESEALSLKYYNMDKTAKEKQSAVDDYLDAEEEGKPLAPYARRLKELGVKKSTVKKARENRKKDRMQRGFEKDVPDYAKGAMNL